MKVTPNNSSCLSEFLPAGKHDPVIILGAGLAGLSSGYSLARAGKPVTVFESDSSVGGLSRTISHGDFRFDLGGLVDIKPHIALN